MNAPTPDVYCEIRYVTIQGAGGSVRRYLSGLIGWLEANPGYLIVGLRAIQAAAMLTFIHHWLRQRRLRAWARHIGRLNANEVQRICRGEWV